MAMALAWMRGPAWPSSIWGGLGRHMRGRATVLTSMPDAPPSGAALISEVAGRSNSELWADLDSLFQQMATIGGQIALRLGETDRRQAFRDEGATSTTHWVVERYGVAAATARALARVGEKAWDVPHLIGALCAGDVSLDKVKAMLDMATPETDADWVGRARDCSVRELAEIARTAADAAAAGA